MRRNYGIHYSTWTMFVDNHMFFDREVRNVYTGLVCQVGERRCTQNGRETTLEFLISLVPLLHLGCILTWFTRLYWI